MKNIIIIKLLFLLMIFSISGKIMAQEVSEMKTFIRQFFIKKGEIIENSKIDISAINIINGKDLNNEEKGIYIIRTVYRTDGNDYLFLKNKNSYEIIELDDIKEIVGKTTELFKENSDELFLKNLKGVIYLYNENKSFENIRANRYKIKLKQKQNQ